MIDLLKVMNAKLDALVAAEITDAGMLRAISRAEAERGSHVKCKRCQLDALNSKLDTIVGLFHQLQQQGLKVMATLEEHAAELKKVTEQFAKVGTEVSATLQKVKDLEAAVKAAGNTTPAVDEAMAALKAQAQATDDLIPDVPPNPSPMQAKKKP